MLGQRDGGSGRQRDAFVGRAKQNVEGNTAFSDGCRVETPQLREGRTRVEQAGVEEVRTGAPGLQGELTEAQNAAIDGKTNEIALIRLHEKNPKYHGFS
ncbi:hypothetical protein PS681_05432 [Pseudomonas fluorescens]|nr:hypothetical protein PS681_05432 [Pseudomonas fluorescens]